MRFYDVPVNRSVPTEANRGLTSYKNINTCCYRSVCFMESVVYLVL
jgi:hypothetical protein